MNCQICGDPDVPQVFVVSNGINMMSVCRACKELTPRQMYEILQRRCDEMIDNLRAMASEAYRNGDKKGYNEAKTTLAFCIKTKADMWEPPQ